MKAKSFAQSNVQPNAWIVTNNRASANLPNDRGRKKVTNGKVYLKDSQEFEIELSNPTANCVLAVILVNGKAISESGLVLRPAERVYLDCFLSDKKKFKFSTYTVDNTNDASTAIQNNGKVEIHFYKEDAIKSTNIDKLTKIIEHHYHHYPTYPYYRPYWYGGSPYWYDNSPIYGTYNNNTIFSTTGTNITTLSNCNTLTNNGNIGTTTTGTAYGTFTDPSTFTSLQNNSGLNLNSNAITSKLSANPNTVNIGNVSFNTSNNATQQSFGLSNDTQVTGRIEKGGVSTSEFSNIEMEFENKQLCTVSFQLLPDSKEPKTIKDFTETNFCKNCGKKSIDKKDNFCGSCGTKLK